MSVILPILVQNLKDYATTVSNLDTKLIHALNPELLNPNNVTLAVVLDIFKLTAPPSVSTVVVGQEVVVATTVVVSVTWPVIAEVVVVTEVVEVMVMVMVTVIMVMVIIVVLFVTNVVGLTTLLKIVGLVEQNVIIVDDLDIFLVIVPIPLSINP